MNGNIMATTKNVETKHDVITFEEASKMSVKDLIESKIAVETAMRMYRETMTCRNKYYLIGAIKSLTNGVGKGYVEADYYAPARYYTNENSGYPIQGVKNIRFVNPEDKDYMECEVKITAPSGHLLPNCVHVDGMKYIIIYTKSKNYSEVVDY